MFTYYSYAEKGSMTACEMQLLNILPEFRLGPQIFIKGKKIQNFIMIPSLRLIKQHVLFNSKKYFFSPSKVWGFFEYKEI